MKILSALQQKEADNYIIQHEPISSINLMERAANAVVCNIAEVFNTNTKFTIVCGLGNNGGDGLAIARLLSEKNYLTEVVILRYSDKCSNDFLENEKRLQEKNNIPIKNIYSAAEFNVEKKNNYIDAIFGTGLNKPIDNWVSDVIEKINASSTYTIAIDIPSGLFGEENKSAEKNAIIKAHHTFTFHSPKLAFMFSSNYKYVGNFSVLDIGIHPEIIKTISSPYYYVEKADVKEIYNPRHKFEHKGNKGHALLVCGSYGKIGAAVLSSQACLRTGAGLLTIHTSRCGYEILQTAVPEAMVSTSKEENFISDIIHLDNYTALGIGPGIGIEKQTQNILKVLIQNAAIPMVVDADALNILSLNKTWLAFLPGESILTPHPKEFERLCGKALSPEDRLQEQINFSRKHNVYVILKGANTSISCPNGEVFFNSTGNPGMATAGSGDVLTGIITSLLAQGYTPKQAAIMGVYLHGYAGDVAANKKSEEAMLASDIIKNIGVFFQNINL